MPPYWLLDMLGGFMQKAMLSNGSRDKEVGKVAFFLSEIYSLNSHRAWTSTGVYTVLDVSMLV